jgi:hypothetical protein
MAKSREKRATVIYPGHYPSPEDLLHFIETTAFTKAWDELGLDDEDDLTALQLAIMCAPEGAPVVQGTGGLRKLRFAPARWNTGTSGATRVCYAYFADYGIILLVYVYDKHQKDTLTDAEKNVIREYLDRAKLELDRRKTIK